jgi:hypothetical protein
MAGCVLTRLGETRFQEWLGPAESYCAQRYSAVTFTAPQEKREFLDGLYKAYYQPEYREIFADRMGVRYPGSQVYIGCLLGRLPKPTVGQ